MNFMFGQGIGMSQEIVTIRTAKNVQKVLKGIMHEMLEGGRGVGQPERHDVAFQMAITGLECYVPFLILCNPHQIVRPSVVKLGTTFAFRKSRPGFLYEG